MEKRQLTHRYRARELYMTYNGHKDYSCLKHKHFIVILRASLYCHLTLGGWPINWGDASYKVMYGGMDERHPGMSHSKLAAADGDYPVRSKYPPGRTQYREEDGGKLVRIWDDRGNLLIGRVDWGKLHALWTCLKMLCPTLTIRTHDKILDYYQSVFGEVDFIRGDSNPKYNHDTHFHVDFT